MNKRLSLSALSDELSQVRTKKREFLGEIERIVPWEKWISVIKPYYYKINRRPNQSKNNSARSQAQIKRREHEKSSVRAKVEYIFAVVKLQLRFRKTRYRGLQKQIAKMNIMFALANLILADRPCLAA